MKWKVSWVQFSTLVFAVLFYTAAIAEGTASSADEGTDDFRNRVTLFGGMTHDGSDSWVLCVPFFLHPYAGWAAWLAPGVEIEEEENNFLFRVGLGYEFEVSPRWSVAPEINVDFTNGNTKLAYGFTLSWGF